MSEKNKQPLVGVVMGSDSDLPVMKAVFELFESFDVPFEARVLSAHRTPDAAAEFARTAKERGIRVLIAGAGWAAHLAGALAAGTSLPIIGVPIDSSPLQGLDALLSTVQMPPGVPVATMAIGKGGARNAALFALQILALSDAALEQKLTAYKQNMAQQVMAKDAALQQELASK